jgi:hypothetical protein
LNLAPATNLALSAEMADTVGSARTWATPLRSNVLISALIALPLSVVAGAMTVAGCWLFNESGCDRFNDPHFPEAVKSVTPSDFMTLRCTSATVTFNMTWSLPRIVRALIRLPYTT